MKTKEEQKRLYHLIVDFVDKHGGEGMTLQTKVGPLHLWVDGDWIFGQFDNANAATKIQLMGEDVNPNNGKWCWEVPPLWSAVSAFQPFEYELLALLDGKEIAHA